MFYNSSCSRATFQVTFQKPQWWGHMISFLIGWSDLGVTGWKKGGACHWKLEHSEGHSFSNVVCLGTEVSMALTWTSLTHTHLHNSICVECKTIFVTWLHTSPVLIYSLCVFGLGIILILLILILLIPIPVPVLINSPFQFQVGGSDRGVQLRLCLGPMSVSETLKSWKWNLFCAFYFFNNQLTLIIQALKFELDVCRKITNRNDESVCSVR